MRKVVVVGGGAAGFFAAMQCAMLHDDVQVIILEKSPQLLYKVKISGGGRCNVTHACFDARQLVKFYPRGEKQLIGPFTKFNPTHTVEWFAARGVELKEEADGRMFPTTDSSQTIIDCFLEEAVRLGINVRTQVGVDDILPQAEGGFLVKTNRDESIRADAVIITTGSAALMWQILEKLEHTIVPSVPSLFTFNIRDERIKDLMGLSVNNAQVKVQGTKLVATGPLLITHWGMSGPAILRLSAWGARELAERNHQFQIAVNWTGEWTTAQVLDELKMYKQQHPKKSIVGNPLFELPRRLWEKLILVEGSYADTSFKQLENMAQILTASAFDVKGKSTNKEEFVTAGGVHLNDVDFKTMQSKKVKGLYLAGEVLDIDAITGGFNFQAAWTMAYISGQLLQ
jgi:predicted Rossmann fold flavoprotein